MSCETRFAQFRRLARLVKFRGKNRWGATGEEASDKDFQETRSEKDAQ